jgi:two-component system, cell cycle response regulator DivK
VTGGAVPKDIILVVDDNETNLKLLRWLLEKKGYEVHTAVDARSARVSIRALRPKLVLMDIQLPDTDGLTLTRELKADPDLRDIPIVAVTSYAMKGDEQKSLDAGCEGYVTKPIDTRQFPAEIEKYLGKTK